MSQNPADKKSKTNLGLSSIKGNRGPWSADDKAFVALNCDTMSYKEIAEKLGRDPITVKSYIKKALARNLNKNDKFGTLVASTDIQSSIIWKELKKEFSEEELSIFIYHWNRIVGQFKSDILPTEELQIVDLVRIEILINRALKLQQDTIQELDRKRKKLADYLDKGNTDFDRVSTLEMDMNHTKAAYESLNKEYQNLLQRKSSSLQEMKATRKERIQKIENSKQTFFGWISELLTNSVLRRELGDYIEKFRIAVDLEEVRLTQPHKYLDNEEDLPILTEESLQKLEQQETGK